MENQYTNKKIIGLLVFGVLLAGLSLFINSLDQRKTYLQKAVEGQPVVVYLDPATKNVTPGESFTVNVLLKSTVDATTNVGGVDFNYDPTKVTISDLVCGTVFSSQDIATVANSTVNLTCHVSPGIGNTILTANTPVILGSFKVTVKAEFTTGQTSLGVTRAVVPDIGNKSYADIVGNFTGMTLLSGGGQQYPVTLFLEPGNNTTLIKGVPTTISVKMRSTQTVGVYTAGTDISFDPALMTVSNVSCGSVFSSRARAEVLNNKIYLSCLRAPGSGVYSLNSASPVMVGTFVVSVKDTATVGQNTILTFTRANVSDEAGITSLAGAGGATNYVIGSSTPSDGTPVLNFKIKSQGIFDKRADQKAVVRIKKGTFEKSFSNVNMVSDDAGIYSGSVTLTDVPVGTGYAVFIKGPRHLAKKLCENNQTNTKRCGEGGSISLVAGINDYNFSQAIMPGGDLPNPNQNNTQDGVVNSVDWSLISDRFFKGLVNQTEADKIVGDINLDGAVNVQDIGLLRNTLETRYEEDY